MLLSQNCLMTFSMKFSIGAQSLEVGEKENNQICVGCRAVIK